MTIKHNIVYRINGFTVNVTQRQVVTAQETINVRPKTFSLLLLFLENPLQVLAKEFLLNQVWDDVRVEEQVLVQSIRELRQLFSPLDIIQTHPRKGYAWVIPVEKVEQLPAIETLQKPSRLSIKIPKVVVVLGVAVLCALGLFVFKYFAVNAPANKNIITVLPIENRTEGSNLSWIRLGMMDQLIQSLQLSPDVQVFDVPYVLHLLDVSGESGVDTRNRMQLVNRIFEISGSSVVVDLELAGSVNDYRLLYRLYTPTDQASGVIMEHQLDQVIESLAKVIATKTNARLDLSHLNAEFNSNVVAQAWDKWNQGQADAAIALLKTAVTLEPDNFLAYQLLIEAELHQQDWEKAIDHAKKSVASAGQQHYSRLYVFYYLLAKAEFASGDLEQARANLLVAERLAKEAFDSLYQAYIASVWGDIAFASRHFDEAEIAYQRAMGHHQTIACPIGVSMARLKLIDLYHHQKRNSQAQEQLDQLGVLVKKHKLPIELPTLPAK